MLQQFRLLTAGLLLALMIPACKSRPDATMETRNLPALDVHSAPEMKAEYRPSVTKSFDLIHTSLDVRFDYQKQQMPAKATIQLHPHFYPTDTLRLNARSMLIQRVARIINTDTTDL